MKILDDLNDEINRQQIPTNLYFNYGGYGGVALINFEFDKKQTEPLRIIRCLSNNGLSESQWVIQNSNFKIRKIIDSSGEYDFLAIVVNTSD
ncbi:hypothetical protein ACIQ57_07170 [Lysinibacillus xylanilyticus]|uniref:hypothetical protein n=1 Tax=Lysinibacillus xylanilyticus TaxID=582475 RepID=UPI003828BE02